MSDVFDVYRDEFRTRVLGGRPRSILEVGSGDGAFLETVRGTAERIVGVDPSDEAVLKLRAEGFEATTGTAEQLAFADASFDVVVFSFTPHHIADWNAGLSEALRVARNGVEILDVWYDDTIADQRTAHSFDRWLKAIDRRTGMVHLDTLSPGELLAPVVARRDVTYDYLCRRIVGAQSIEETLKLGAEYLAKVENDADLKRAFDQIIANAQRDGMTDEGCIQMTIEKRR